MANEQREALIKEATELNVEFEKNISTINLQKRVDEKKEELERDLKGADVNSDESVTEQELPIDSVGPVVIDTTNEQSNETTNELPEDKEIDDTQDNQEETETENELSDETYEDEMVIERTSKCGNYKAKIIGLNEAARRSGLTIEEVKECLESGVAASNGWKFKKIVQ